jgi:hypothetical protein
LGNIVILALHVNILIGRTVTLPVNTKDDNDETGIVVQDWLENGVVVKVL